MRYFTAPSALLDALRDQVMQALGQPNGGADQPWPQAITCLALAPHEYTPPQYAALIATALANGATEVTAEEYAALQTPPPLEHAI
jgi:hypothetical protein